MHPIFITLGPLTIRWYGVCVALGFLAGYHLFLKRAPRLGLNQQQASNLILLIFLSGILGARVYYVILNWQVFRGDLREILRVDHGGLVFHGGFIGAMLGLGTWSRWSQRSLAATADALAPSLVMGQIFGRFGCFMNGCCHGKACDHFWAIHPSAPPEVAGQALHPTQLYEVAGLVDIFVTLLVLEKLARYPGYVTCAYVILYAVLRFIVEFFRGDVPHDLLGRFTGAQGLSAALLVAAWATSVFLARRHYAQRRTALVKEMEKLR